MVLTFVELPPFERHRATYLDEAAYRALQGALIERPDAGTLIPGTGGLRKLRFGNRLRGSGKRGGLRVIYYWWVEGRQCWLFTIYAKSETDDLTSGQRRVLKRLLEKELVARRKR